MKHASYQIQVDIPVKDRADVVVIGGGPAGIIAALAAARRGCKTILIEKNGFLGGAITASFVVNWEGFLKKTDLKTQCGRVITELIGKLPGKRYTLNHFLKRNTKISFDIENFKDISCDLIKKAGIKLLLYTYATGVIKERNIIKGVILESRSGKKIVAARIVIDATGDGDIAFFSGAPYYLETKNKRLPLTLIFRLGGVTFNFNNTFSTSFNEIVNKKCQEEFKGFSIDKLSIFPSALPNEVFINMSKTRKDIFCNNELTSAQYDLRKQMHRILRFLKKEVPGFQNSYIIDTAPQVGIRETRRIKGLYTITSNDILKFRKDKDFVIPSRFLISSGKILKAKHNFDQLPEFYIPYRCLIVKGVDNILTAGRCISTSHGAFLYTRNISTCMSVGEAAGIAAAICCKENILPRNLKIDTLKKAITPVA